MFVMLKLLVVLAPKQFKYNLKESCSPSEQVLDILPANTKIH